MQEHRQQTTWEDSTTPSAPFEKISNFERWRISENFGVNDESKEF